MIKSDVYHLIQDMRKIERMIKGQKLRPSPEQWKELSEASFVVVRAIDKMVIDPDHKYCVHPIQKVQKVQEKNENADPFDFAMEILDFDN